MLRFRLMLRGRLDDSIVLGPLFGWCLCSRWIGKGGLRFGCIAVTGVKHARCGKVECRFGSFVLGSSVCCFAEVVAECSVFGCYAM